MTENEAEKTSGNETAFGPQEQTTATPARAGNPAVLTAMVMVMVLVIAGTFYLTGKIRTVEESINSRIENIAGQSESVAKQIDALNNEIDQLRTQFDTLADSITGLYQQLPVGNEDWALSEIEYLLIIATHRIMLERDVDTALAAMEAAELRLRDLNNPDLIPVREQFVADINKLKDVNQVDVTGLSIYLADIIDRANSLPLKRIIPENGVDETAREDAGDQEHDSSAWRNFLSSVWQELKSLVVIKRSGETRQALLPPDQEYYLYQNLRLELENARLSVLRRDTQNLHTSVNLLVSWLEDYFNSNNASVANIIETLQKMSTLELKPELPDINSSLETLRAYLRMNKTGDGKFPGTEIPQP